VSPIVCQSQAKLGLAIRCPAEHASLLVEPCLIEPIHIVQNMSLRHIVAITGHLIPNAPLTRKLRSKGRISPLYVLGRTSQDKPACHVYAHSETHTHEFASYHGMMTRLSLDQ